MKKILAIIQARMSSERLPGKVLMEMRTKPMLWYVIQRTKQSKLIDKAIVATSTNKSDNLIVNFCKKNKVTYFRGNLNNVLERYYEAAKEEKADIIVRVTADCPLIDGQLIDQGIKTFKKVRADYLSNTVRRTYPRGFDFEVFSFETLVKAHKNARSEYDKEHVTPYIWKNLKKEFKIDDFVNQQDKSKYRITVDTIEDFELIKILIEKHHADKKNYRQIIKLLESNQTLVAINSNVHQKGLTELKDFIIRKANESDLIFFFKLRNLPQIVNASFNKHKILLENHKKWFYKKMKNPNYFIYTVLIGNKRIGQARVEVTNNEGEISISLLPQQTNKGYGTKAITKVCENVFLQNPKLNVVYAHIKNSNASSMRAFEKCGFVNNGIVNYKNNKCYEMQLKS